MREKSFSSPLESLNIVNQLDNLNKTLLVPGWEVWVEDAQAQLLLTQVTAPAQKCFNLFPGHSSWHQTLWPVCPGFSPNSVFLLWFSFFFCCWEVNVHFDELELSVTEPRGWCCCTELWSVCKLYKSPLKNLQRTLVLVAFPLPVGLSWSNLSTEVVPRHFCAV